MVCSAILILSVNGTLEIASDYDDDKMAMT